MAYLSTMDYHKAYRILHVMPGDSSLTIKRAYRKLVKAFHPDRFVSNPSAQVNAEEQLKEINQAYALIKNAPLLKEEIFTSKEHESRKQETKTYSSAHYYEYIWEQDKHVRQKQKMTIAEMIMHFVIGSFLGFIIVIVLFFISPLILYMNVSFEFWNYSWLFIIFCGIITLILRDKIYDLILKLFTTKF